MLMLAKMKTRQNVLCCYCYFVPNELAVVLLSCIWTFFMLWRLIGSVSLTVLC